MNIDAHQIRRAHLLHARAVDESNSGPVNILGAPASDSAPAADTPVKDKPAKGTASDPPATATPQKPAASLTTVSHSTTASPTPPPKTTVTKPAAAQPSANSPAAVSHSSSSTVPTLSTTTTSSTASLSLGLSSTPLATIINTAPATIPGDGIIAPPGLGTTTPVQQPSFSIPSSSPSASAGGSSSSGSNTTKIIGFAAAGIVGVAVLIAAITFVIKRCTRKRHDEALGDVFDRAEFSRHSQRLPDDMPIPGLGNTPSQRSRQGAHMAEARPPTMLARHLQNYGPEAGAYGAQPGYPPQQQHSYPPAEYGAYGDEQYNGSYSHGHGGSDYGHGGYEQQQQYAQYADPGYAHGHAQARYDSPMQSPMGDAFPPPGGAAEREPAYLNHQVGGTGRALTAGPGVNLDHLGRGQSVTPFQAAQYAEISRRLTDDPRGQQGSPAQAYERLAREPSPPQHGRAQAQAHGRAPIRPDAYAQRPPSVYDETDAYGGI